LGEDRAAAEFEPALPLIVEKATGDVAGQQVGGELNPLEGEIERLAEQPGDQRLREAGIILDQDMAVG
jgi:hypothetical protein